MRHNELKISQAKRMKDVERENAWLKKAVADLTLDKVILKERPWREIAKPRQDPQVH